MARMRRHPKSWRIALAFLLLLGTAGGLLYWDWASPTRRTQRLLSELEGREPSFFTKILSKIGLAKIGPSREPEEIAKDLIALGPGAVPALLAGLDGNAERTLAVSAVALGRLRDRRAVGPLVRLLDAKRVELRDAKANDKDRLWGDSFGRVPPTLFIPAAIWALGEIGDPEGVRAIVRCIRVYHPDGSVAPKMMEECLIYRSMNGSNIYNYCLASIRRLGLAGIPALIECMRDPEEQLRVDALDALTGLFVHLDYYDDKGMTASVADMVREPLLARLTDKAPKVRYEAAHVFEFARFPWGVDPLLLCLHDPNEDVRYQAATSLGEIGDAKAFDPLLAARPGPTPVPPHAVLGALRKIGGAKALPYLVETLQHADPFVRASAAEEIGALGWPDGSGAEQALRRAVKHEDGNDVAQYFMLIALGQVGGPDAIPDLDALLPVVIERHREDVAKAIAEIRKRQPATRPEGAGLDANHALLGFPFSPSTD